MTPRLHLRLLLLAGTTGLVNAAYAADLVETATADAATTSSAPEDASADTITVLGERQRETVLPQRPPTSIYGLDALVVDTPRSISQVSGAQLLRDPIKSTDDFVKYAPGITRGGGQGNSASPSIRGLASEVFQNGQRIYKEGNDHPINLNAYESADIVAGPSSVIFGPSSSTGGYVNYITKKPFFDKQRSQITAEIGSWAPDDKNASWSDFGLTLDTGGPLSDQLAYRISIRGKRGDTYYRNVENNYNSFYGALAWRPANNVRIDWNGSIDNYYDFNVVRGWNRPTQELVDNYGSYYGGRATPIIRSAGVGLWSPVFASSNPTAAPVGWQVRTRDGTSARWLPGPVQTTPLPSATVAGVGSVVGWVYDPTIPGNGLTEIEGSYGSGRAQDKNSAKRYVSQLQVGIDLSDKWNILSSSYVQRSTNDNDSVGSFIYKNRSTLFDQRLEIRGKIEGQFFGLASELQSNSGASFRTIKYSARSANNNFNYNPYDLTLDPSTLTPSALYGLPLSDPNASGSWIGAPGSAQLTPYFGYLTFPAMVPTGDGFYAEVGGTPPGGAVYTSNGHWDQWSVFTQQNLRFGDVGGINLGGNITRISAYIANPVVTTAAQGRSDRGSYTLPSYQVSAYLKPTANSTVYVTYDKSEALNTGVFGSFLTWGANNKLNPLAFHSVSELYEGGIKADLIPGKLFASASGFVQYRDLAPDINGNIAKVRIRGLEGALRYQPLPNLSAGANVTYLNAVNTFIVPGGFSPFGFFADGVTVWGDNNRLIARPGGRYAVPGVPKYSANGFVDYRLDSGLGAELSVWYTGKFFTNLSQSVAVPDGYQANVTVYYRHPRFDLSLRLVNATNQKNFLNALTGGEFLQPVQPRHVQGQVSVRF